MASCFDRTAATGSTRILHAEKGAEAVPFPPAGQGRVRVCEEWLSPMANSTPGQPEGGIKEGVELASADAPSPLAAGEAQGALPRFPFFFSLVAAPGSGSPLGTLIRRIVRRFTGAVSRAGDTINGSECLSADMSQRSRTGF